MRIWHLNVGNHAGRVDGVAMMSTSLANEQAALGHDVHLWVATEERHRDAVIRLSSPATSLQIHPSAKSSMAALIATLDDPTKTPDVVHLHSVFRPVHSLFGSLMHHRGIPVVHTPHAGLDPTLLRRDRSRKEAYRWLVERRALRRASAVVALQRLEAADVKHFSGRRGHVDVVPNPADRRALERPGWVPPPSDRPPVAVMLSRYDVLQKGLDRMVAMAEELPDVEFRVHGAQDKNGPEATAALRAAAPSNVRFLAPVYDEEKYRVLEEASVFLQPSRAEGLSLALLEALAVGAPCAVSTFVDRSLGLDARKAALVLDDDPHAAAAQLGAFLSDDRRVARTAAAGRAFAARECHPDRVCAAYLAIYRRVTGAARLAVDLRSRPPDAVPTGV